MSKNSLPPPDTSNVLSRRFSMNDDDPPPRQRTASVSVGPPPTLALEDVAPNPLNTRDVRSKPKRFAALVKSLTDLGQIHPCAVIEAGIFVELFPEHAGKVGRATHVQVGGGRRLAALGEAGIFTTIDVVVKNDLGASRAKFLEATYAENDGSEPLDPIEDALALKRLAVELKSQSAAAEQLGKTAMWATHVLNLLKLAEPVQAALRLEENPLTPRAVRDWHNLSEAEQLAELEKWRRQRAGESSATKAIQQGGEPKPVVQRPSMIVRAIRKLPSNPEPEGLAEIGATLRERLAVEARRALAEELLRED